MTYFFAVALVTITAFCFGLIGPSTVGERYGWSSVTKAANFPEGYNYPVYVFSDWMVALNNGAWLSKDGSRWVKTDLPESGLNSAYQKFFQFNGAIYAPG